MIITFNGPAGSGKSTIAKKVAEKLGWPHYYIGGIRRQKAQEKGMTLAEYNKLGENTPETDYDVDEYQKKLSLENDNFVIEGRTSWHIIPNSLKIYLDVAEMEGAKRVYNELSENSNRNEAKDLNSVEDVLKSHRERKNSDILRYKKYYNIDVYNTKNFDFVLDTTDLTREQVFENTYDFIKKQLEKTDNNK